MSNSRPLLFLALTAVVGLSSQPVARLDARPAARLDMRVDPRLPGAASSEHDALPACSLMRWARRASAAERPEGEFQDGARWGDERATPGASTPRALLGELLRAAPEPGLRALALAGEPLLDFLPLAALRDVRRTAHELVLEFETGSDDALLVTVPPHAQHVLDADPEDNAPELHGRAVVLSTEPHTLRIHKELRFRLDADGIAGVHAGDLELCKGPFHFDLALRTERKHARAHDRYGRPLLATDATGTPTRVDGRWRTQSFDLWVVIEALGHAVEVGVPDASGAPSAQAPPARLALDDE